MSVTFHYALLCDQVRQEVSGKYIAIGIYSGAVIFGAFPGIASFTLFSRYSADSLGSHSMAVRTLVDGVENQRFEGGVEITETTEDWAPLPIQPIQFQVPGVLSAEQQDDQGNWREFFRVNVRRPDPTASPLPS